MIGYMTIQKQKRWLNIYKDMGVNGYVYDYH